MARIVLVHSYEPLLFLGSVAIAAFAGYVALWLIGRARTIGRTGRSLRWLGAASAAMGVGIWSMHFTGMLALRLPVPVGYEPGMTVLSMAIAVVASLLALEVVRRERVSTTMLAGAATLMGAAISGMHYTGMAAMRFPGEMHYVPGLVVASVLVAVVASGGALGLFLRYRGTGTETVRWVRISGGVVLGLAVSGMHYTAMAAARFGELRPEGGLPGDALLVTDGLAVGVGSGTLVLLGLGLLAAFLDRQLQLEYATELNERTRVFERVFRDSPVGIALVSSEGEPVKVNRRLAGMLGYTPGELQEMSFPEFTHPEDVEKDVELFGEVVSGERDSYQIEKRYVTDSGEMVWADLRIAALRSAGAGAPEAVGFVRDITERKEFEEALERQALHDPLTGLANRTLLADRVEQGLARAERADHPLGLLMLDVDHFKRINDRLGHLAGDRVLTELARRLEKAVREEDTVARWGGDEFVVVLPELAAPEDVDDVRERIRAAVRAPIEADGEPVHVGLTVGAVVHSDGDRRGTVQTRDPEELLRFGSLALHWAKEEGPGSYSLFDGSEEVEGAGRIRRERELRDALEQGEIVAHYQPVVNLSDGAAIGVEALARWRHPERGLVPPADFIPLAEELGLIGDVQEAVVRRACREVAAWEERSDGSAPVQIGFNVSGQQFGDSELTDRLVGMVEEAGCRPEQVTLEVTETSLMQVPARVDALRDAGFQVYIDDFGTGYSTFTYLRDLEVDGLKVDMTFVQGINEGQSAEALVETMLTLGGRLGLRVVAEGVETEEQREALRSLGCQYGQGYLFAPPVPGEELADRWRSNGGWAG